MSDRIDRLFGFEEAARQKEMRADEVKAVGGVFDAKQETELKAFLVQKCWLTPKMALKVYDDISAAAGDEAARPPGGIPVKPIDIVTGALSGHVKDKFLENAENFTEAAALVTSAMGTLKTKLKAAPAGPSAPKPGS